MSSLDSNTPARDDCDLATMSMDLRPRRMALEKTSRQDLERLRALDRALRFARAELTADVTAQRLLILICVFFNEGLSQRELLKQLESTSITALSRNLADLSSWTTKKADGPGLIELRTDPMNLRIKRVYLTVKGRRFVRRWLAAAKKK